MKARLITIAVFLGFLIAPGLASAATTISDPAKFVSALYVQMAKATEAKPYNPPDDIYTPRLSALFELDRKEAGEDVGRIDFDFWSDAQDWQISNAKVTSVDVENTKDRKVVIAKFKNFGKPEEIHFYFERGKKGWLLDDARSVGKESWVLSLILKYGWNENPL